MNWLRVVAKRRWCGQYVIVLDGRLKGREEFGDEVAKVTTRCRSMWRFLSF